MIRTIQSNQQVGLISGPEIFDFVRGDPMVTFCFPLDVMCCILERNYYETDTVQEIRSERVNYYARCVFFLIYTAISEHCQALPEP